MITSTVTLTAVTILMNGDGYKMRVISAFTIPPLTNTSNNTVTTLTMSKLWNLTSAQITATMILHILAMPNPILIMTNTLTAHLTVATTLKNGHISPTMVISATIITLLMHTGSNYAMNLDICTNTIWISALTTLLLMRTVLMMIPQPILMETHAHLGMTPIHPIVVVMTIPISPLQANAACAVEDALPVIALLQLMIQVTTLLTAPMT